jgi:hypothetical protein
MNMHAAVRISVSLLLLAGCATVVAPRQYLDKETAATITVVANPWVFVSDDANNGSGKRGFLNLYTLDVNRAGTHQRYFAVMQASFDAAIPDSKSSAPILELEAGGQKMVFQSIAQSLRQLGVGQPLDEPFILESRWWCFPVTKDDVAAVAQTRSPRITLTANDARFTYVEFRSGSKELMELSATLQ